jgi:Lipocalin-like domain
MRGEARLLLVLGGACLLVTPPASVAIRGNSAEARDSSAAAVKRMLVGTWQLASFVLEDDTHAVVGYPYGKDPAGKLTYTRDGQMWAFTGQEVPSQAPRDGNYYTGTFRIDVEKRRVIHRVQYSSIAAWESTLLLRRYEFSGTRRLTLRARFGEQTGVLRWRKITPSR